MTRLLTFDCGFLHGMPATGSGSSSDPAPAEHGRFRSTDLVSFARKRPWALDAGSILALQRTSGNSAVAHLLRTKVRDLSIQRCGATACNCPEEPDRIAEQTVGMPKQPVQRKCGCGGSPGGIEECEECETKRLSVQGMSLDVAGTVAGGLPLQREPKGGKDSPKTEACPAHRTRRERGGGQGAASLGREDPATGVADLWVPDRRHRDLPGRSGRHLFPTSSRA